MAEEVAGAGGEDEGGEDVGCCGGRGAVGDGGHWVVGNPVIRRQFVYDMTRKAGARRSQETQSPCAIYTKGGGFFFRFILRY